MKRNYEERKEARRVSVLNGDGEHIGVWGNLKKLCEDMKETDSEFLSYSSISKKSADGENPIRFKTESGKSYSIHIEKIR